MRLRFSLLFLAAFLVAAESARGDAPSPAPTRLENGLSVLIRPVRGAAEAAVVVLFSVGGDHDPEGKSGLAHLVEHLYVTAAAGNARARTAEELMRRYPNRWNAQTGDRYTVIATVVPADRLEAELEDAAARMGNLRVTAQDLDRERPRMLLELEHMYRGVPGLAAMNLARDRVRPSPRGGRKGGRPEDVMALTREDAEEHWRRHYKPVNALLVVAGAVDPGVAGPAIERCFGRIPAGEAPAATPGTPEPESVVPSIVEASVEPLVGSASARACVAYRVPDPADPDYAPFLVLAARLLRDARGATPSFPPPLLLAPLDDPHVLFVSDAPGEGETADAAVARIQGRVAATVERPLGAAEVRSALEAWGLLLGTDDLPDAVWRQNVYGLAFGLGRRLQMGVDPTALRERIRSVTAEVLAEAAARCFSPERRGAAVVRPAAATQVAIPLR